MMLLVFVSNHLWCSTSVFMFATRRYFHHFAYASLYSTPPRGPSCMRLFTSACTPCQHAWTHCPRACTSCLDEISSGVILLFFFRVVFRPVLFLRMHAPLVSLVRMRRFCLHASTSCTLYNSNLCVLMVRWLSE